MFMFHGAPKMFSGPEKWEQIGGAMGHIGINFAPVFWGFLASFAEFFGGLFLILGLFSIPVAAILLITMAVATIHHLQIGDGLMGASHALENAILFLSLIFIGPGKFSLDRKMR